MSSMSRVCQSLFVCTITAFAVLGASAALMPAHAALVTAQNSGDACMPITMPTRDALFNTPQRIFAHYLPTFPASIDNRPSASDYYNVQYLNPAGENGKFEAQGGFLRQRPSGVPVQSNPKWKQLNMQHEVSLAMARGIQGFAFDIMSVTQATDPEGPLQTMLAAASAIDSRFKIIVTPDMTVFKSDPASVIKIYEAAATKPAAYHTADGRLIIGAYDAGLNSAAWWKSVFSQLAAKNIRVAFVPTFLGWMPNAPSFDPISSGFGDWGTATPFKEAFMVNQPAFALSEYGKFFVMPVDPQQYRPKNYFYYEAGNSAAFRSGWNSAITGRSSWVLLVTWNDFSESSQVQPYSDATVRRDIGTGYYDLTGYYAAWLGSRVQPKITHDVLYYFYRREPSNSAGPRQSEGVTVQGSVADDKIELLAFLTAPGVLKITIGGQTYTHDAPAGLTSFMIPTQPGIPLFALSRDEAEVFSFQGGVQIYGPSGIPSGVIDMTYWSGSASKTGVCAL
ncbi:MAG TPA: glycoside hydrolase family 71 protein [Steroidobacteraceae bacterium]|nr:glycoside hydrolase family 71 protein [Steroidobacteraceae bacterium]